jgi:hypothetical protein
MLDFLWCIQTAPESGSHLITRAPKTILATVVNALAKKAKQIVPLIIN